MGEITTDNTMTDGSDGRPFLLRLVPRLANHNDNRRNDDEQCNDGRCDDGWFRRFLPLPVLSSSFLSIKMSIKMTTGDAVTDDATSFPFPSVCPSSMFSHHSVSFPPPFQLSFPSLPYISQ